jgi:putative addiction module CopG family antidote
MTVRVELSPELEQAINEKVRKGEFPTADDLVRQAVRHFIEDDAEVAHTEALLQEAVESGGYLELTEHEWDSIEREAVEEVEKRRAGQR